MANLKPSPGLQALVGSPLPFKMLICSYIKGVVDCGVEM